VSVSARDLYFVLRVRDEASNVLTGVSRDILKIGAAAQASSARAESAALRQQAANVRAAGTARVEALKAAEAQERETAARMRAAGATKQQIAAVDAQARAYSRQASAVSVATDKEVASLRKQAAAYDMQAKNLEADVAKHQRLSRTLTDVSSAATIAGLAMVGMGALASAALLSTVKAGQEYDRQVALTKTQTDGFAASLQDLGQMGKDVASKVAAPFAEMQTALYDIFSSTNANMSQAKVLLDAFAKAAVAGQVSIDDSSRSTMSIMNAFKIPFQNVNTVLDKQFQLVRKGVGTYAQFSSVIGKLTPSAVRLGQNLDTMDAMLIFLTRNGLSTASAVAAAARAMDALANPSTTAKLEELGIKSRDATGKFLPLVDILKNMKKYLLALPPPDRAKALFDIFKGSGGTIQAKRFFDLALPNAKGAGNLDQFQTFLKDMQGSTGQFSQAYQTMADTVASKTQLLKNNFNIMKTTIGQALEPAFKRLLDIGAKIVGWFNGLSPAQQKQIAKWALIAAAVTTLAGVIVIIIGGIGALAAAMTALGISLGTVLLVVGGVAAGIVALAGAAVLAYKGSAPLRNLFSDIGQTFSDVWTKDIWPFIQGVKQGFDSYLQPAFSALGDVLNNKVIPAIDDLWNRIGSKLVAVLGEVARFLKDQVVVAFQLMADMIKKVVVPMISSLTDYYNKHKGAIDKVIWAVMQVVKWFLILLGSAVLVALVAIMAIVVAAFYVLYKTVSVFIDTISILVRWVKNAIIWMNNLGNSINNAADAFGRAIKTGFNAVISWFQHLPGYIRSAVISFRTLLIQSGKDLINGLLSGIDTVAGRLLQKAKDLGNSIKNAFNTAMSIFSPSRAMMPSGAHIVNGIGVGIDRATPALLKKVRRVANNIKANVDVGHPKAAPVVPSKRRGPGEGKQVVVNVYTQEIRPEYHSQQLGQLIASTA